MKIQLVIFSRCWVALQLRSVLIVSHTKPGCHGLRLYGRRCQRLYIAWRIFNNLAKKGYPYGGKYQRLYMVEYGILNTSWVELLTCFIFEPRPSTSYAVTRSTLCYIRVSTYCFSVFRMAVCATDNIHTTHSHETKWPDFHVWYALGSTICYYIVSIEDATSIYNNASLHYVRIGIYRLPMKTENNSTSIHVIINCFNYPLSSYSSWCTLNSIQY